MKFKVQPRTCRNAFEIAHMLEKCNVLWRDYVSIMNQKRDLKLTWSLHNCCYTEFMFGMKYSRHACMFIEKGMSWEIILKKQMEFFPRPNFLFFVKYYMFIFKITFNIKFTHRIIFLLILIQGRVFNSENQIQIVTRTSRCNFFHLIEFNARKQFMLAIENRWYWIGLFVYQEVLRKNAHFLNLNWNLMSGVLLFHGELSYKYEKRGQKCMRNRTHVINAPFQARLRVTNLMLASKERSLTCMYAYIRPYFQ